MSLRTKIVGCVVAISTTLGSAHAAVECPKSHEGRRPTRMNGASLFLGEPSELMNLAPDTTAANMQGSNIWQIQDPTKITLVCRYEGIRTDVSLRLSPDIRTCTQNLATGAMSCR